METRDYLRAIAKRIWVVVLVPLIAGGVGLAYVLSQPPSWVAGATVTAHPASAGAGSVLQYINTFQAAMSSDSLSAQVAQETGETPAAVSRGLSVAPIGANSLILKVTYITSKRAVGAKVAERAARDTLALLARPALSVAQATLNTEQAQYEKDKAAMDEYLRTGGLPAAELTYQADLGYLSQLQVAYQLAVLANQPTAAGLKTLVTAQQQRVDALSASATEGQRLSAIETRDATNVGSAQSILAQAQAELATANDPAAVVAGYTSKASRLNNIVYTVGPIVVFFLVAVIGVILIRANRRYRRGVAAEL